MRISDWSSDVCSSDLSVAAAALLAENLYGYDEGDPATTLAPAPRLLELATARPPLKPGFAFVRQPAWDTAAPELHDGFAELREALGEDCEEIELPGHFGEAMTLYERSDVRRVGKGGVRTCR